jgi:DNA invertase Pin-like site-specific DNA recombinase
MKKRELSQSIKKGMSAARRKGVHIGRPSKFHVRSGVLETLEKGEITPSEACALLGVSPSNLCHLVTRYEKRLTKG